MMTAKNILIAALIIAVTYGGYYALAAGKIPFVPAPGSPCSGTSASLDMSSYSGTVGGTVTVISTVAETQATCGGALEYNPSSWQIIPATTADLDCNGSTNCTFPNGSGTYTVTLKCEAAGTYTIRADSHQISGAPFGPFSSTATVTCSSGGGGGFISGLQLIGQILY